jgi:hypothetical protein
MVFACIGCGCTPRIAERTIDVTLDNELVGKPVAVLLYGANASDVDVWKRVPLMKAFDPSDPMKAGPIRAGVSFDATQREFHHAFPPTDPAWERWKQREAWDLVVLAYIPGSGWDGPPENDPRRVVIPLNACQWNNVSEPIRLQVHKASITLENPPK